LNTYLTFNNYPVCFLKNVHAKYYCHNVKDFIYRTKNIEDHTKPTIKVYHEQKNYYEYTK